MINSLDRLQIELPLAEIQRYCEDRPIKRLAVFGSVLRDDFSDESDIDLMIEYMPGIPVSLIDMAQQEIDLSDIVGRKIDLRTPNELSPYFRQQVVETAVSLYERS